MPVSRTPGPTYDPRGKANRALLIGVYQYPHEEDLPGVKHNLEELRGVLLDGGVFGAEEVQVVSPAMRSDFLSRLDEAVEGARGLLLLYFAGHGNVSLDGSELFLRVGESRRVKDDEPDYTEAVSWKRDVLRKLRDVAECGRVDHIVVILDCCYAGNALEEFKPGAVHRGRDRISVLTAVQVNRRIPGGSGREPTPYTKQLVRLLREGAGDGTNLVRLRPLTDALREAMGGQVTESNDPWEPRHHRAESDQEVLLALVPGQRSSPEPRPSPWRRIADWLAVRRRSVRAFRQPHRRLLVPLVSVCAVVAAAGGFGIYLWEGTAHACAPPVEVRLLTDPDVAPTLNKAVDMYLGSAANRHEDGCRRSGISVASPKAADVVTGFLQSQKWQSPPSGDFQPQRDLGAQPDIWIPGSEVSYERAAAGKGPARLHSLGSVAYSPLVLAVPQTLLTSGASVTGNTLAHLVATLQEDNRQAVVVRADPEYTDSGQLATVGLYGENPGETPAIQSTVKHLERQAAQLSPAPRSSYELMCALAEGAGALDENQAAVLVPEQVMALFNNRSPDAPDRPGCGTGTLSPRTPQYPENVGMLDLPFVRVTWQGADRDTQAREQAVSAFHNWLTGPDGQLLFTQAGYRGLIPEDPGTPKAPADNSWLVSRGLALSEPEPIEHDVNPAALSTALDRYRQARGPGRVLYLLDVSASMGDASTGLLRASKLLSRSLGSLGAEDAFGIWTVSGNDPAWHELLGLGNHADLAAVRRKVVGVGTVNREAFPGPALRGALETLQSSGVSDEPRLIVFITDDEDNEHLTGSMLKQVLAAAGKAQIPVDWVSLGSGGCTEEKPGLKIAQSSGGRCLNSPGSQALELSDDVARVGMGDKQ